MDHHDRILQEHRDVTRRYFLQLGAAGIAGLGCAPLWAQDSEEDNLLAEAIAQLEYLTPEAKFVGGGRGNPPPYKLTAEQRREAGLHPDTWQLEVIADPTSDVQIETPLSKELGTALDWPGLMALAEKRAVVPSGNYKSTGIVGKVGVVGQGAPKIGVRWGGDGSVCIRKRNGASERTRTADRLITNQLLYH